MSLSIFLNLLLIVYKLVVNSVYIGVSYYSEPQLTANGEYFNPEELTCASPTLPFNTLITLQKGANIVTVRVNDRGPFAMYSDGSVIYPLIPHPTRILDLSERAYIELFGNTFSGTGKVWIINIEMVL